MQFINISILYNVILKIIYICGNYKKYYFNNDKCFVKVLQILDPSRISFSRHFVEGCTYKTFASDSSFNHCL